MKLIRLHIENFGGLHDFSMSFHDGINTIRHQNGWGKSTLAAFIRVMFFGFDGEARRTSERERTRYRPWQTGVYGGQIVFEADGRHYRIERVFREKKADDSFFLYDDDTNLESLDFTDNIGEELFRIDASSFEKTVFIRQLKLRTEMTSSINAKIAAMEDETADLGKYETAQDILKRQCSRLSPYRSTGEAARLKAETERLKAEVYRKDEIASAIEDTEAELKRIASEKAESEAEEKKIHEEMSGWNDYLETRSVWQRYEDLKITTKEKYDRLEAELAYFPKEVPSLKEAKEYQDKAEEWYLAEEVIRRTDLSQEERSRMAELRMLFQNGIPTEDDIRTLERDVRSIRDYADASMSANERADLAALKAKYNGKNPDPSAADKAIAQLHKANTKELKLPDQRKIISDRTTILLLFLLMTIAGILMYFTSYRTAAVILMVIGVLGILALLVFLYTGSGRTIRRRIAKDEDFIDRTYKESGKLLKSYGIKTKEENYLQALYDLRNELQVYQNLSSKDLNGPSIEKEELKSTMQSLMHTLNRYYGEDRTEHISDRAERLKSDRSEYIALLERYAKLADSSKRTNVMKREVANYITFAGMEPREDLYDQMREITDQIEKVTGLLKDYRRSRRELESYRTKHNMNNEDGKPLRTTGELTESFENCQSRIRGLDEEREKKLNELDELERQMNAIRAAETELTDAEDRLAEASEGYRVAELAGKFLESARNSFNSVYLDTIRNSFNRYVRMLGDTKTEYIIDTDLNISVRSYGENRSLSMQSEGMQDLAGLCRRAAMVDAMYSYEKPFLIMDDPFVNFDEDRIAGGLELLDELSEQYQIIYFTCHESRCPL